MWFQTFIIVYASCWVAAYDTLLPVLPRGFIPPVPRAATASLNESLCYNFSWMGRAYNKKGFVQIENKTCEDFFSLLKEPPLCIDPMVATDNGMEPNIELMYSGEYSEYIVCPLDEDKVCAKYTWIYNGVVANVTRYCTRINVDTSSSMESGCVTEYRGPYQLEVCACRTEKGAPRPCNQGGLNLPSLTVLLLLGAIAVVKGWS